MLTILIPAAGAGSRFVEAGYSLPKPLIDVVGQPMIKRVMDNVRPVVSHQIVIVSRLDPVAVRPLLGKNDVAIYLSKPTEGAIDTLLKASRYVTDDPLMIANSDQLVGWDVNAFIESARLVDGAIVTFKSDRPHHSYVVTNSENIVQEIAEKRVISNQAVTGVYYFRHGSDFLHFAEQVIQDNDRHNSEFYVSSALSRMIKSAHRFVTYEASTAILGTPSELQLFEQAVRVGRTIDWDDSDPRGRRDVGSV